MPGRTRRAARHRPVGRNRRGIPRCATRPNRDVGSPASRDDIDIHRARTRGVAPGEALSSPGLVTVAGKGGVGKSRLTVRVATARRDFVGGRLWVSLAPVAQDALVASTIALEVGVPLGTDDAAAALADHLAPLGRVLLVLDGCEIVVDGVASFANAVLASCPQLTIVVTSRVPLSIEGERLIVVEPLDAPAAHDAQALLASPQVRLLIDRCTTAAASCGRRSAGSAPGAAAEPMWRPSARTRTRRRPAVGDACWRSARPPFAGAGRRRRPATCHRAQQLRTTRRRRGHGLPTVRRARRPRRAAPHSAGRLRRPDRARPRRPYSARTHRTRPRSAST